MQTVLIGDLESAVRRRRGPLIMPDTSAQSVTAELPDTSLPLLIEPDSSSKDLSAWLLANRDEVCAGLRTCGGILFREFSVESADGFQRVIETVSERLLDYSYRSTPRTAVSGKIYSSTEYPPHQTIPLHNENSYAHDWPMKIWFFSQQCAETGGETPIADSRRVYKNIPAPVREQFERKGVMYVRNYGSGFDLPWQEVFQTANKSDVESYCNANGIHFEWLPDEHLRTRQICPATARHPLTDEMVWFNQAHLFHVSRLPGEVRDAMLTIFAEEDLPRNVFFGDGSPIDSAHLDQICEAYEKEKVVFSWAQGDVLLLDNMLAAHGRNPFKGQRQVVVGMAEPHSECEN